MSWFDRYGKLRESIKAGSVYTGQKDVLGFLNGKVTRDDIPAAVIEAANEEELRATMRFASQRHMKLGVASGSRPHGVAGMGGQLLVLTSRMSSAPIIRASRQIVRVDAGVLAEGLSVDLNRSRVQWLPLWPVPSRRSIGELVSRGWEGVRNWQSGGALGHVRAIEWLGYDGKLYSTGQDAAGSGPDLSGLLFGSRGRFGIITSVELALTPMPERRTAALFELPDTAAAVDLMAQLRRLSPQPEAVVYFGETATDLIRQGNDNTVTDAASVLLFVEWNGDLEWPEEWLPFAEPRKDDFAINALWQDVLRMQRTASRIHPARLTLKLNISLEALAPLADATKKIARDSNLSIVLWGTTDSGWMQTWILLPDEEQRTRRRGEETLKDFYRAVTALNGKAAAGEILPFDRTAFSEPGDKLVQTVETALLRRCDPEAIHCPLGDPSAA